MTDAADAERYRVDKWLWAARFYKTRSQAAQAVSGGHVLVNGARVKPARAVQADDLLTIRRGEEEFVVVVLGLSGRRGPASQAQTLYEETEESRQNRELARLRRLEGGAGMPPPRRPDKRDRRKIRKLLRKE